MRKIFRLVICCTMGLFLNSCVTTSENTGGPTPSAAVEKEIVEGSNTPSEKTGIIYSSRQMNDGPLLLGSKDHMSGAVVEFSILYSLYFPMSGILIPENSYKMNAGTRWHVVSDKFNESVFFERALLSEDDEGNSWWYLLVEGDGYRREFEFLLDSSWILQEMRFSDAGEIKSYFPSVDEVRDLSNGSVKYRDFQKGNETVHTDLGTYNADHIVIESREYWMNSRVTGDFIKSLIKIDDTTIAEATLIEEKKGYNTLMNSF